MKKRICIFLFIMLTAAAILTGCGKGGDYKKAMSLYENGQFEEAAEKYVEAAGNLGFSVTKESIMGFLEAEEKQMRKITADAENAVKVQLTPTHWVLEEATA